MNREQSARLEAKLRGDGWGIITRGNALFVTYTGGVPLTREPLDIFTDTGLLDAMELAHIVVIPIPNPDGKWLVVAAHDSETLEYGHNSPRAATKAAWEALAEKEFPGAAADG